MLKIGGVKRSRGQHDDPGVFFIVRGNFRQPGLKGPKKIGQVPHIAVVEQGGHDARHRSSIFERVSQARRCLCVVVQNPHLSIGSSCEIGGIDAQLVPGRQKDLFTWPQKTGVIIDKFERQQALSNECLGTVDVFEHEVEQFGALRHPSRNMGPVIGLKQHGYGIEFPGVVQAIGVAVYVVCNAVFTQQQLHFLVAARQFFAAHAFYCRKKGMPMGAYSIFLVPHFVVRTGFKSVSARYNIGKRFGQDGLRITKPMERRIQAVVVEGEIVKKASKTALSIWLSCV